MVKYYSGAKTQNKNTVLNNIDTDNQDKRSVLNNINNFFINQCPTIQTNIVHETPSPIVESSLFLNPTNHHEVYNTIMSLKNTKAVGSDEIPVKLLKHVAEEISHPLTHIINLTLNTGIFPEILKSAQVKAVYKKGKKHIISNYRAIALLSNASKIFEKIIYNRFINFLENHQVLSDTQNGFRKRKSTTRAAYQALCKILDSMNDKLHTVAISIDLTKAFDSVEHDILIRKIENYGIRGTPLQLIKSYLSDRSQCVTEIDENNDILKSNPVTILRGVPQGSILGPLLYILYTNDLPLIVDNVVQYADDTTLIISEENEGDLDNKIFNAIGKLEQYFTPLNLKLNPEKTQVIKFSNRILNNPAVFTNGNTTLTSVKNTSFLGIKIDTRLDWKYHIECLSTNMAKYCYALKVISQNINSETAFVAYHAYIQSRIRYGIIFWGNSSNIDRVFILQKRCLRNILNMKQTDSCRPIFIERGILTITSQYILEAVIFVSENRTLFNDCDRTHPYDTRNKHELIVPNIPNYSYIQKNVHSCLIKIFNKLPNEIKTLPVKKLKLQLKNILINKAYYVIEEYLNDGDIKCSNLILN